MKTKSPIFVICLGLISLIAACQKEAQPEISGTFKSNHIETMYTDGTCMVPEIPDSNSIIFIDEDTAYIYLHQENENIIGIPQSCVLDYSIDTANWSANFLYINNETYSLPFLGNTFDIPTDSVTLNPYGTAPLTALIQFSTPVARRVKVSVRGKSAHSAEITHVFTAYNTHHQLPVFGLYINTENTVDVSLLDINDEPLLTREVKITTADYTTPDAGFMKVVNYALSADQKNRLFLISNCVYDGAGDIRWYTTIPGTNFYAFSNYKIAIQVYPDRGTSAVAPPHLHIIDYFGRIENSHEVPNRIHHEVSEQSAGGNILVASNHDVYTGLNDDTEDMIFELDRESGTIVKSWDLRDIFDPTRPLLWDESPNDWFHLNSIQYDPEDNTLLISSKIQYCIAKIDYQSGAIKWILGNHENWKEAWQPYLLTPTNFDTSIDPDYDYPYAQHTPVLTPYGTIMVYDNGGNRPGGEFTRAVEYRVNEQAKTVEKVWEFTDVYAYAYALGSVHTYADSTLLIGHGYKRRLYLVNHDKEVLFEGSMSKFYRSYPIVLYRPQQVAASGIATDIREVFED